MIAFTLLGCFVYWGFCFWLGWQLGKAHSEAAKLDAVAAYFYFMAPDLGDLPMTVEKGDFEAWARERFTESERKYWNEERTEN